MVDRDVYELQGDFYAISALDPLVVSTVAKTTTTDPAYCISGITSDGIDTMTGWYKLDQYGVTIGAMLILDPISASTSDIEGAMYYDIDDHRIKFYNGTTWLVLEDTGGEVVHNETTDKQGGDTDEYYHLTAAQHVITINSASGSQDGYLLQGDWTTFNGKADSGDWRGIDDTPVENETIESITSNWAFEHEASPSDMRHLSDTQVSNLHSIYTLESHNNTYHSETYVTGLGAISAVEGEGTLDLDGIVTIAKDLTIGDTTTLSNRLVKILADDLYIAELQLTGSSQGSGVVYVGQTALYGGGIAYYGDTSPSPPSGSDRVTLFRRNNSATNTEVMSWGYSSNDVSFTGNITLATGKGTIIYKSHSFGAGWWVGINSSGAVYKAQSDNILLVNYPCIGVTTASNYIMISGVYTPGGTPYDPGEIYSVDATEGTITTGNSESWLQRVGVALSNAQILVMPSLDVLTQ